MTFCTENKKQWENIDRRRNYSRRGIHLSQWFFKLYLWLLLYKLFYL